MNSANFLAGHQGFEKLGGPLQLPVAQLRCPVLNYLFHQGFRNRLTVGHACAMPLPDLGAANFRARTASS